MCDTSKATIDELKYLRKSLLYRFNYVPATDKRRNEYRLQVNAIARELVRRTGDKRWKL